MAISYDYEGAGAATGYSARTIQRAVRAGDLTVHYPAGKPVVLAVDLEEWVRRAPTTPPSERDTQ